MLYIPIPQTDIPHLDTGVPVRINGQSETIRREGDYLCYGDNRCMILDECSIIDGKGVPCISFTCARTDKTLSRATLLVESHTEHQHKANAHLSLCAAALSLAERTDFS